MLFITMHFAEGVSSLSLSEMKRANIKPYISLFVSTVIVSGKF